jgi:hypothetical protein
MRGSAKTLITAGALTAALCASAPAIAATSSTSPPALDARTFACSGSVCEVGPGNVGMSFAAGLNILNPGSIGQDVERFYGDDYTMKIISGSLPPGLQLSLPSSEWTVTGTPTKAGTYPFTVQFAPTQDIGGGPAGTQQLTITIGTGTSDRVTASRAVWSPNSVNKTLQIAGFDVNAGLTYSVFVTATGKQIGTITENPAWNDGFIIADFRVSAGAGLLSETNPGTITIKSSLGSSSTFPVTVNLKYS